MPTQTHRPSLAAADQGILGNDGLTFKRRKNQSTVICRDVPAEICDNFGEYYLSEETTREVMKRAEAAVRNGAEVEILRFAA